ncbi:MAG: thioredoxin domain-containing protein, partial [Halothece sp. Uz-M2-17]|nr:thioredoxin domain-containing protein [Halothece sp. Uz-M2-17]
ATLPETQTNLNQDLLIKGIETGVGITSHRGTPPSFPMIPYAQLALRGTRFNDESRYDAKDVAQQRGYDLALGGIYDHVGGGFHRYTVDGTWTVPHFEKMLYDNGQIVEYLANLWSSGVQEPAFKSAIAHTVEWLQREMTAPEGYFYGSQDADSFTTSEAEEPEEGAFYVWSYRELETLLTAEELQALQSEFTVTAEGNFEGSNVLQRQNGGNLSNEAKNALKKLFNARYGTSPIATFPPATNNSEAKATPWKGRIPPVTDTKMITAWNSLMISGLARAYAVFGENSYWNCAVKATNFIWENQWVEGRFHRLNYNGKATVSAQSEDYALFIKALLDLHACHPEQPQWLDKAVQLQAEFDEYLWSVETGGYFNTANDSSNDLIVRERTYIDNATPAANGVAVANLIQLFEITEQTNYLASAEKTLHAFSSIMEKSPQACPGLFSGLDWYLHGTLVRSTSEQLQALMNQYLPTCTYRVETHLPDSAIALVCKGLTCLEPATDTNQMMAQIRNQ